MKTNEWKQECTYISDTLEAYKRNGKKALKSFNQDLDCFKRYCEMQSASAERDGVYDAQEYIQSCVDDIEFLTLEKAW